MKMNKLTTIGILLILVGVAAPVFGVAIPTPLEIVTPTTYFTLQKAVSNAGNNFYVNAWYGPDAHPPVSGLQDLISVPSASPTWAQIQAGMATYYRVSSFGANALPENYILDGQDSLFWYAHVGQVANPTPTPIGATPSPSPYPTQTPRAVASIINYVTFAGIAVTLVGYVSQRRGGKKQP